MPEPALNLRIRILHGEVAAFGTGKAALLEAIDQHRSIAAAGRALGLSYSKTRRLVEEMNDAFQLPLVGGTRGGAQGGGAQVTETGRKVLALFRAMEAQGRASLEEGFRQIQEVLAKEPETNG